MAVAEVVAREARSVVLDFEAEGGGEAADADGDGAAGEAGGDGILHRVFDEGLDGVGGNFGGGGGGVALEVEVEAVAEAGALDFEVVLDETEFLGEGDEAALLGVEGEAEEAGETFQHGFGAGRVIANQGEDGVDGIEEKVRLEAGFEGGKAGFGCELLGVLSFEFLGAEGPGGGLGLVAEAFEPVGDETDDKHQQEREADATLVDRPYGMGTREAEHDEGGRRGQGAGETDGAERAEIGCPSGDRPPHGGKDGDGWDDEGGQAADHVGVDEVREYEIAEPLPSVPSTDGEAE